MHHPLTFFDIFVCHGTKTVPICESFAELLLFRFFPTRSKGWQMTCTEVSHSKGAARWPKSGRRPHFCWQVVQADQISLGFWFGRFVLPLCSQDCRVKSPSSDMFIHVLQYSSGSQVLTLLRAELRGAIAIVNGVGIQIRSSLYLVITSCNSCWIVVLSLTTSTNEALTVLLEIAWHGLLAQQAWHHQEFIMELFVAAAAALSLRVSLQPFILGLLPKTCAGFSRV